ncbi:MAG TPA: BMC domain-containing protein [Candidatus Flavonifractor merdavium]|nr:BMC domain-containing protein [Candidatus Flavonifractor merdavium]
MQQKSLGLIETQGLAAGVVAADAAVKSANVELIGYELTKGGGWTLIKVQGDVGAVKAAVDAAAVAAGKVNRVVSTRVIARPSSYLEAMVHTADTVGDRPPEPPKAPEPPTPPTEPEPEPEPPVEPTPAPEAEEEVPPEPAEEPEPEPVMEQPPEEPKLEPQEEPQPESAEEPAPEAPEEAEAEPSETPEEPAPEQPAEQPAPEAPQSTRTSRGSRRGKNKRS